MANLKKLKRMAIEQKPAPNDISSYESLKTNFAYSVLVNTKYKQEIEELSVEQLSRWLKEKQIQNDYQLLQLTIKEDN